MLGQVLTCLDQRTQQLKTTRKGSLGQINKPGFASAAPTSKNLISVSPETVTVKELNRCVDRLETIKRMVSKAKVPVVLVYRERKHRTHHRHEEKGQSNKVVFAKEKRDFLSLLGLPGAMISEKGIDFTVRPNTASNIKRQKESLKNNNATETTDVGEMEPDEKNGGAAVQTDLDNSESPKTTRKILQQYLSFKKKGSVSPQPEDSTTEEAESETKDEEFADVRSTLSCDSCSSDESSETDEETDINTDIAVPGVYAHQESIKPPPFFEVGMTYVVLAMEKLGVKNTARLVSPFLRVSVRDPQGKLVGATQDTEVWEVVNKNYLRAPSQVHLQHSLEQLPDDMAIFLELRYHRPEKGSISTLCYTFLERQDLSNGEFVCELYNPPVDYTKKSLITYTEKAFFLHLEVMLKMAKCEVESLESTHSFNSS
ncbi:axin interactor, dorsalization-associated protein [Cherax quadricarinatus]|uniref:axin interactor, dorsalization-associated protein n=1 Tax=Cherax quadricarinatus TaxID=27406 RepID=UPI00387E8E72